MAEERIEVVRRCVAAWAAGDLAEVAEAEAAGDEVYALVRITSHGAGSGIENVATFPFVFTIHDGLIVRWRGFVEASEAREAASLPT